MGEYARYNGREIKIGTCESMYYLRADQARLVEPLAGSVDPVRERAEIRFRFPFPDEDGTEPGCFEDHDKGLRIPGGWTIPSEYEHDGSVQFKDTAELGYLLSVPCPESAAFAERFGETLKVHKNGWRGGYVVKQQRYIGEELWTVVACSSCGCAWRLPAELAETVACAFAEEAVRQEWRVTWEQDEAGEWRHTNTYAWQDEHQEPYRSQPSPVESDGAP